MWLRRWGLAAALLALTATAVDGGTDRRRRGASRVVERVDLNFGDRTIWATGSETNTGRPAGTGPYYAFPRSVITAADDVLVVAYSATNHAIEDPSSLAVLRSSTWGRSWQQTPYTVTTVQNSTIAQETPGGLWLLEDGTIALTYMEVDADNTPSRHVYIRYSRDNGASWSDATQILETGTEHTSDGGDAILVSPGVWIKPYYYRDCVEGTSCSEIETRYTAALGRGVFNTSTGVLDWTAEYAVIAQDPEASDPRRFSEPNIVCLEYTGEFCTGTILALVRDDLTDTIYTVRSIDAGATWDEPTEAFAGMGWPAVRRTFDGTIVATTRSPEGDNHGVLYSSDDDGVTWRSHGVFQQTNQGPYEYASWEEVEPNVLLLVHAQELLSSPNGRTFFESALLYVNSTPPATRKSTGVAVWPAAAGSYVDYGGGYTATNGAANVVIQFWDRMETDQGGSQDILVRNVSGGTQRHLVIRYSSTSDQMQIFPYAALSGGTIPSWTSAASAVLEDRWTHWAFVYTGGGADNAGRLRVCRNGINVSAAGTYGNTIPATLTTPTSGTWRLGAAADGTLSVRSHWIDDLVIWVADGSGVSCGEIYNQAVQRDPSDVGLGAPSVELRLDSNFTDARGNFGTPTITGSPTFGTFVPSTGWRATESGSESITFSVSEGCGVVPPVAAGAQDTIEFTSDGLDRDALLSIPTGYSAATPLDCVVIDRHGCSGNSAAQRTQALGRETAYPRCAYFYPQGLTDAEDCNPNSCGPGQPGWCQVLSDSAPSNDDRDIIFTDDMLTWFMSNYCVHTFSRDNGATWWPVNVQSGDSNGGYMANNLATFHRGNSYALVTITRNAGVGLYPGPTYSHHAYLAYGVNDSVLASFAPTAWPVIGARMALGAALGADAAVEPFTYSGGAIGDDSGIGDGATTTGCRGTARSDGGFESINADGGTGMCCLFENLDGGNKTLKLCTDTQTNHTFYDLEWDNQMRFFFNRLRGLRGDGGVVE